MVIATRIKNCVSIFIMDNSCQGAAKVPFRIKWNRMSSIFMIQKLETVFAVRISFRKVLGRHNLLLYDTIYSIKSRFSMTVWNEISFCLQLKIILLITKVTKALQDIWTQSWIDVCFALAKLKIIIEIDRMNIKKWSRCKVNWVTHTLVNFVFFHLKI